MSPLAGREHNYGPWLDVPPIEDLERRCKRCGAKEWRWRQDDSFIYGNDLSRLPCVFLVHVMSVRS